MVEFVGREKELSLIKELVFEQNTRHIVCIHGPGGIGKTRFLEEVRQQCEHTEDLLFVKTLDFDERLLHRARNFGRQIANQLGGNAFADYFQESQETFEMRANLNPKIEEQQKENTLAAFIKNFNNISNRKRIVLPIDTMEKMQETEVKDYLLALVTKANNTIFLLAGRNNETWQNNKSWWEILRDKFEKDVSIIELHTLSESERQQYLEQKQNQLHVKLKSALVQELIWLSQGKPLLLDLAVESLLLCDDAEKWVKGHSVETSHTLTVSESIETQKNFEIQLVQRLVQLRSDTDRLLLLMSRVYPLEVEVIVDLLKTPPKKAAYLFDEVKEYVFVKTLPDNRITLHDEMRRMIRAYVWPEIDPQRYRQREESKAAKKYLEKKIHILIKEITKIGDKRDSARKKMITKLH